MKHIVGRRHIVPFTLGDMHYRGYVLPIVWYHILRDLPFLYVSPLTPMEKK